MMRGLFFIFFAVLCCLPLSVKSQEAAVGAQKVGVPAYFQVQGTTPYTSVEWERLLQTANLNRGGIVVINPCSGPEPSSCSFLDFAKTQTFYRNLINSVKTQTSPPKVLGYVSSNYGKRSVFAVLRDMRRYQEIYETQNIRLDGFFIDELDGLKCARNVYYKRIYNAAKSQNRFLVLNPGTEISGCYLNLADVFVTFEGKADDYINRFTARPLETPERADRFWHIVYDVTPAQLSNVVCLSKNRNAGYVYATDARTGNIYEQFPANNYWTSFLNLANAQQCGTVKQTGLPN